MHAIAAPPYFRHPRTVFHRLMASSLSQPRFRLGYRPALDGLRAIAILLVLGYHAQIPLFRGGFLGVDLFFVLSGFLITTILIEELQRTGSIRLWHFYKKRFLRLLPALAFLMVVYVAVSVSDMAVMRYTLLRSGIVVGYISNWVMALDIMPMNMMSHTWSLAIEAQFYILFPILLGFLAARCRWQTIRMLLLGAIVVVCLFRLLLWASGAEWYRLYYGTDTRADALFWGCWLGATLTTTHGWRSSFWSKWARQALTPALLLLGLFVTMANVGNIHHYSWSFPAVALIGTLIIFHLVTAPQDRIHRFLAHPLLVGIGKISYGLYLWHYLIFSVIHWLDIAELMVLLVGTPLSIALALLSYYGVERPFLRRSRRSASYPAPNTEHKPTPSGAAQPIKR